MLDGITHVIRGQDHVSNTPTQINILTRARRRRCRSTPTARTSSATTARSSRSGTAPSRSTRSAQDGYIPEALMNFLALLGWSYDDKTTVMTPGGARRALLARAGRAEPRDVRLREARLAERRPPAALDEDEYAERLARLAARAGDRLAGGARARDGAARPGEAREALAVPGLRPLPVRAGEPGRRRPGDLPARPPRRSAPSSRGRRRRSSRRCARFAEAEGLKPREAFAPIRLAVTGSKVSPGLFESLELLGKDEAARAAASYGRYMSSEMQTATIPATQSGHGPARRADARTPPRRRSSAASPRAAPGTSGASGSSVRAVTTPPPPSGAAARAARGRARRAIRAAPRRRRGRRARRRPRRRRRSRRARRRARPRARCAPARPRRAARGRARTRWRGAGRTGAAAAHRPSRPRRAGRASAAIPSSRASVWASSSRARRPGWHSAPPPEFRAPRAAS